MWKRHSHRNEKSYPGYVPEMPCAFYWTPTGTLAALGVREGLGDDSRMACLGFSRRGSTYGFHMYRASNGNLCFGLDRAQTCV